MKKRVWSEEARRAWHDGYYIFDIINYATWRETTISRYGDDGFYKRHQDTRFDHITYRLVTIVYYVNGNQKQFDGGTLNIWQGEEMVALEPIHNRAIVFPSFMLHEVEAVHMKSGQWEDGRFSVNYWMGFK